MILDKKSMHRLLTISLISVTMGLNGCGGGASFDGTVDSTENHNNNAQANQQNNTNQNQNNSTQNDSNNNSSNGSIKENNDTPPDNGTNTGSNGETPVAEESSSVYKVVAEYSNESAFTVPKYDASNSLHAKIRPSMSRNEISQILNSETKRYFYIEKGNYRSLGRVVLTKSGNSSHKRYLLLDDSSNLHPASLAETRHAEMLLDIKSNYWVVDRISFIEETSDTIGIRIIGGSHNLITRYYSRDTNHAIEILEGNTEGRPFSGKNLDERLKNPSFNTIQQSHLERTQWSIDRANFIDRKALGMMVSRWGASFKHNYFINNEIINYGDSIQLTRQSNDYPQSDARNVLYRYAFQGLSEAEYRAKEISCEGTIVAHNILRLDDLFHGRAVSGSGKDAVLVQDIDGKYMLAETPGVDVKLTSTNPNNAIIIQHNYFLGGGEVSKYFSNDGGATVKDTDFDSWGGTLVTHQSNTNIVVQKNVFIKNKRSFVASASEGLEDNYAFHQSIFRQNTIFSPTEYGAVLTNDGHGKESIGSRMVKNITVNGNSLERWKLYSDSDFLHDSSYVKSENSTFANVESSRSSIEALFGSIGSTDKLTVNKFTKQPSEVSIYDIAKYPGKYRTGLHSGL